MTHFLCVSPTKSGRLKQVVELSGTRADPCSLHLLLNFHRVISLVRKRWVFPPISPRRASFPPTFPEAFITRKLLIWTEKSQNPPSFFKKDSSHVSKFVFVCPTFNSAGMSASLVQREFHFATKTLKRASSLLSVSFFQLFLHYFRSLQPQNQRVPPINALQLRPSKSPGNHWLGPLLRGTTAHGPPGI